MKKLLFAILSLLISLNALAQGGVGSYPISTVGNNVEIYTRNTSGGNFLDITNGSSIGQVRIRGVGGTTVSHDLTVGGTLSATSIEGPVDLTTATGVLAVGNGGTGLSTYAVGDLLYASGATTLSKLAGVATGNALISGGVTTAPSYGKIGLATHISGTLPIANGGTDLVAVGTANQLFGTNNGATAFEHKAVTATAAGALTAAGAITSTAGAITATSGNIVITSGTINMATAASQLIPGATSFAIRNNANSADNLLISNAGALTARTSITATAGNVVVTSGYLQLAVSETGVTSNTSDGTDNKCLFYAGAGSSGDYWQMTRGASFVACGNELSSGAATIRDGLSGGGVTFLSTGALKFRTAANAEYASFIPSTGVLEFESSNGGDIHMRKSGITIRIQEATSSTACAGVATPNGTSNVTVTTSCAISGRRVVYSRIGAVTNMGVISTTTNPNGSSFTFASTNGSDTLASSVYYWIIGEAS